MEIGHWRKEQGMNTGFDLTIFERLEGMTIGLVALMFPFLTLAGLI